MALTLGNRRDGVAVDGTRTVELDVTFDASYVTGGLPLTATAVGLRQIHEIHVIAGISSAADAQRQFGHPLHVVPGTANNGRGIRVDFTNPAVPKLILNTAASTEAANASDQSAYKFHLILRGV